MDNWSIIKKATRNSRVFDKRFVSLSIVFILFLITISIIGCNCPSYNVIYATQITTTSMAFPLASLVNQGNIAAYSSHAKGESANIQGLSKGFVIHIGE